MYVLLVEDDPVIADGLCAGLRQAGHSTEHVASSAAAHEVLQAPQHFDAVILDLGLPDGSGLEVLRRLRSRGSPLPVLVLTAHDGIGERIRGLDSGADDFLGNPFDLDELAARLRAIVRRRQGSADPMLAVGGLRLDPATRGLTDNGRAVPISAREYALLETLMRSAGRVVPRERLQQGLYGWADRVDSNVPDVHIHNLRRKLGADRIRTVRSIGYLLSETDVPEV